ncbi:MAG: metallophosphoesterase [Phormidesmis sp.]
MMNLSDRKPDAVDFTRLVINNAPDASTPFSFLVIGDTDAGIVKGNSSGKFSFDFAKELLKSDSLAENKNIGINQEGHSLILHTGDITYPIGSYQSYLNGFLRPYRFLLSQMPKSDLYTSENVVFNQPFFPVPGNHDYGKHHHHKIWRTLLYKVCNGFRKLGLDFGHYGGEGGEAYDKTFLDNLSKLSASQLRQHLINHYSASAKENTADKDVSQYCLNYCPNKFTRLPNRYYQYRYRGVDFFALDSNTWNMASDAKGFDQEQLDWLEKSLIQSWQADLDGDNEVPKTIARIVYLHHSPYTTEESRWQQPETLWVRRHLRAVLDRVDLSLKQTSQLYLALKQPPLIDLVLSGHAHCFEHVKTGDTGHADSHTDWIVCGGSGVDIRRQRQAGADILERISEGERSRTRVVATSRLYAGVHGRGQKKQKFHSFIKVQIDPQNERRITIHPFLIFRQSDQFQSNALTPIEIASNKRPSSLTTAIKMIS